MSMLYKTEKPPFFAVIYTSPLRGYDGTNFGETGSMLVALAAAEPGYLGFESEYAAEDRTVVVCYWDSFQALSDWLEKAKQWTPGEPSLEELLCTTGCLWPWLLDECQVYLESAARSVA